MISSAEKLKLHTESFHSGGANTLNFIVDGDNAVKSMSCSQKIPWNMVVPLIARHGVHFIADVNVALHVALERSVVDSTGSFTNEIWLEQLFHVKESF